MDPSRRNTLALVGFVLAVVGVLVPIVLLSLAGGIVSAIALRHSRRLAASGSPDSWRGFALAGVLIGFIWAAISLLGWGLLIAFVIWAWSVGQNVQFPGSPVI